jgi:hypothetical protein
MTISHECEWAFPYQFFAAGTLRIWRRNVFGLKHAETGFLKFPEQVHLKIKK